MLSFDDRFSQYNDRHVPLQWVSRLTPRSLRAENSSTFFMNLINDHEYQLVDYPGC